MAEKVSIAEAMGALGCPTKADLARQLTVTPQAVQNWKRKYGGFLPPVMADRFRLLKVRKMLGGE